jgi:hypothetical protein
MLSLVCGIGILHLQWKPASPAQLAELFLIERVRRADCHSDLAPILIGIASERLSTSVRNHYRHQFGIAIDIARNPHEYALYRGFVQS